MSKTIFLNGFGGKSIGKNEYGKNRSLKYVSFLKPFMSF